MTHKHKLTPKNTGSLLGGISPKTVLNFSRKPTEKKPNPAYDPTFPEVETIGRSKFIDSDAFYKWLSDKAGFTVSAPDKAITSPQLQTMLDKSHTWLWKSCKEGLIVKPFKIGRLNFWMLSQFEELQQAA